MLSNYGAPLVRMSSKKKGKSSKSASATTDSKAEGDGAKTEERLGENGGREGGGERAVGGGGLKAFVKAMEGSSHRVVEMRLGVVGACAVAFRVLLYDDLDGRDQTVWGALTLVGGEGERGIGGMVRRVEQGACLSPSVSQCLCWC